MQGLADAGAETECGMEEGERWVGLMRAAQGGDSVAYRRLLAEIAPVVRRIALGRWGRFDAIDDVVQDVLLSVHSVRHTYDPARPFLPWLLAIIRHRMADTARRHARRSANEVTVGILPETFPHVPTNPGEDGPGDPELLHRAIAALPPGQRQAVELLKLQEMSLKEAAAASGQSVAALKVAMHRALKALTAALRRETTE
jgi:RNA polymerase sigma-70 factor (ECF subfamily)